jgi:hypothetical protein
MRLGPATSRYTHHEVVALRAGGSSGRTYLYEFLGGFAGERDAGDLLEVVDEGDFVPFGEEVGEGVVLAVAYFEGE